MTLIDFVAFLYRYYVVPNSSKIIHWWISDKIPYHRCSFYKLSQAWALTVPLLPLDIVLTKTYCLFPVAEFVIFYPTERVCCTIPSLNNKKREWNFLSINAPTSLLNSNNWYRHYLFSLMILSLFSLKSGKFNMVITFSLCI